MSTDDQAVQALEARRDALAALPRVVGTALGKGRDGEATICIYVLSGDVAEEVDHRARALLPGTPIEVLVTGSPAGES